MHVHRTSVLWLGPAYLLAITACGDDTPTAFSDLDPLEPLSGSSFCDRFIGGIGGSAIPDAIRALRNDPALVGPDDQQVSYLLGDDRVIGIELDGTVIAVPLNIGWHHEIVNLEVDGRPLAVSYCPLTGSALAFDRETVNGANFLVSGWLVNNNLVMFDDQANGEASLWPQMSRGARCSGPRDGTALPMVPIIEMTWDGWRALHPDTRVVAGTRGPSTYHRLNTPYPGYLELNSAPLFDMAVDRRRPTKERVLGVPEGEGGIAFPFGALDSLGATAVIQRTRADGSAFVVLWDRARQAAMAYRPVAAGESLTLEVKDGVITDVETGSTWEVDGRARSGPLAGAQLEPIAEAYIAFWFGWAAFQPETLIWAEDTV